MTVLASYTVITNYTVVTSQKLILSQKFKLKLSTWLAPSEAVREKMPHALS